MHIEKINLWAKSFYFYYMWHGLWSGSLGSIFKIYFCFSNSIDISDVENPTTTTPPPVSNAELDSRQQALNYSTLAAAAAASVPNGQDPSLSSTETLLRNIQGLLKVAADNARQQERQINFEKGKCDKHILTQSQYHLAFSVLIQSITIK